MFNVWLHHLKGKYETYAGEPLQASMVIYILKSQWKIVEHKYCIWLKPSTV